MVFPKSVRIYLFGTPIASNYPLELLCIIAWILKLSRISSYLSIVFNSYLLPNAYLLCIWSLISFLYTTEKYLQSTPFPSQVILILVVEFVDDLHFWLLLWITCFYCQTYLSNSFCLPCIFLDFGVLYPNLFCALLGWKSNDPILVHLHSKVILLDNALFLGKLSYFV